MHAQLVMHGRRYLDFEKPREQVPHVRPDAEAPQHTKHQYVQKIVTILPTRERAVELWQHLREIWRT